MAGRISRAIAGLATSLLVIGATTSVSAQEIHTVALQRTPRIGGVGAAAMAPQASGNASWWTPLASLVVPGSGQALMKQQRGVGYLVVEGYLLIQAASAQRSGNRDRTAYRRVAADVARAQFGGARPNGAWPYYEAMEIYLESGAFDAMPGGSVQPETDVTTFNGSQWLLARETYWNDADSPPPEGSAEYQRALEFYQRRAVRDEFRWSWRDAQLQQDVYRQSITSANRNYQRAVNLASAVAANHLLSMVDAYISVRLRRFAGGALGEPGPGLHSSIEMLDGPFGSELRHTVGLRVPLPRRQNPQ